MFILDTGLRIHILSSLNCCFVALVYEGHNSFSTSTSGLDLASI